MEVTKSIVLLDDHVLIRAGLKELIEKLGPFKIAYEFDNGEDFLTYITQIPEPDLIISDLNMPGMDGDEVLEKLNEKGIKIPVLILTVNEDEDMIIKLFRLGARGYLRKNCKAAELRAAINSILITGYYHNEFLTYSLRANPAETPKTEQEQIIGKLSPREREFLKLVCDEKEYTYQQISDLMCVEHRTVDGYRESIFEKFGIKSKTGLLLFVLKNKLIDYL